MHKTKLLGKERPFFRKGLKMSILVVVSGVSAGRSDDLADHGD